MREFFKAYKEYIIKQIKHKKVFEFQPTNWKFDADALYNAHTKVNVPFTEQDVDTLVDFVEVSKFYNRLQKNFCSIIEKNLYLLNLKGSEIAQYLVSTFNQQYRVDIDLMNESMASTLQNGHFAYDILNPQIESIDPSIGPTSIRGSLELTTDSLNYIMNKFLRGKLNNRFETSNAEANCFAEILKDIYLCPQPYIAFMFSYDDILYNEGFVRKDTEKKMFIFDYESHRDLKLLVAGDIMFHDKIMLEKFWTRGVPNRFYKNISGYRIKKALFEDGIIQLKFAQNEAKDHKMITNGIQSAINSFYAFMDGNTTLPLFDNATIDEAISILIALQYIVWFVLSNMKCDKNLVTKDDFKDIPCKIKIYDLVDYIAKLTTINKKKIKLVLTAMMSDLESIKYQFVWKAPLYKIGEYCLLPFFPLMHTPPYYLIDKMLLEKGGFNLQERGEQFEKYLYKKITSMKTSYPIYCIPAGKYGKKSKEEIDLVISTKKAIFVGEAKCIHYSQEPREHSEAWSRLVKGCEQAKRKALFIKENIDYFIEKFPKLGENNSQKGFVPFVVTNYPTYTGFCHNGVYIIDTDCLIAYLKTGRLTNHNLTSKGDSVSNIAKFYDSEDQFSDNFSDFLANNPLKEIHMRRIDIEDKLLTPNTGVLNLMPDMEGFKAISKSAQIKHDEQIILRNK